MDCYVVALIDVHGNLVRPVAIVRRWRLVYSSVAVVSLGSFVSSGVVDQCTFLCQSSCDLRRLSLFVLLLHLLESHSELIA